MFSGALSDYFGKRKPLMLLGYGLSAATKPVFPMASSIISVAAARFLDRVGKGPARVNNWNGAGVAPNMQDQFSTRMDHSFSDSHKLFGRFSWSNITRGGFDFFGNGAGWVNPGGSGLPIDVNARNLSLDDTPTLLLNVRYGFVRQWVARDPPLNGLDLATLGFPSEVQRAGGRACPSLIRVDAQ